MTISVPRYFTYYVNGYTLTLHSISHKRMGNDDWAQINRLEEGMVVCTLCFSIPWLVMNTNPISTNALWSWPNTSGLLQTSSAEKSTTGNSIISRASYISIRNSSFVKLRKTSKILIIAKPFIVQCTYKNLFAKQKQFHIFTGQNFTRH